MGEEVRVAITERTLLKWPQRCPRCGSTDFLVSLGITAVRDVGRRRASQSATGYFMQRWEHPEFLRIQVPMCPRHARPNQIGGALLRDDLLDKLLRLAIYVGFASVVLFVMDSIVSRRDLLDAFAALRPGLLGYFAFSIAGTSMLVWASHVAWVRPIRLDAHYQTAILRFKDVNYAADFRRMNPEAIRDAQVSRFPEWLRPRPANAVFFLVIALLAIKVFFLIANR